MSYLPAIWSACSQLANVVLLNGHPNESISGRCHGAPWPRIKRIVNALFWWQVDHCKSAYSNDVKWAKAYVEQNLNKA
jgi:hypothetical protein